MLNKLKQLEINKKVALRLNSFNEQIINEAKEAESFKFLLENSFEDQLKLVNEIINLGNIPEKTNADNKIDARSILISKDKTEKFNT